MSRMVGGTFGVAVMGALVATVGRAQLDSSLPQVPAATRAAIANSLGGGAVDGGHASLQIVSAIREAFVTALGTGLTVGAIVTAIGAVLAFTLVQRAGSRNADIPTEAAGEPETAGREAEAELTLV